MRIFGRGRPREDGSETVTGYRDLMRLGEGGFSVVYRADQVALRRAVALKVLTVPLDEKSRARFLREVETTGELSGHPHVVTVLDAGLAQSGRPYLAMDLYEHGSLMDRLEARGPLPARDVALVGTKIAGALQAAHEHGIVHRDVKPNNILISRYGEPALADFGIACLLDAQASSTVLRSFTPHHAAPEVLNGAAPTATSDVYALGSTLYQLAVGTPPFTDENAELAGIFRRILEEKPPALPCPDLPGLAEVVQQAMAKYPQDRYADAASVVDALRELVPDEAPVPLSLPQQPVSTGSSAAPTGPADTAPEPDEEQPRPVVSNMPAAATGPGLGDETRVRARPDSPGTTKGLRRRLPMLAVVTTVAVLACVGAVATRPWQYLHPDPLPSPITSAPQPAPPVPSSPPPGPTAAPSTPEMVPPPSPSATPSPQQPPPVTVTAPAATHEPAPEPSPPPTSQPTSSACSPGGCAAQVRFTAYGEHLSVCDNKADSHSAVAWYRRSDVPAQNNEAWNHSGDGGCVGQNMNIPEGTTITYKACLGDYKTRKLLSCSAEVTSRA